MLRAVDRYASLKWFTTQQYSKGKMQFSNSVMIKSEELSTWATFGKFLQLPAGLSASPSNFVAGHRQCRTVIFKLGCHNPPPSLPAQSL